MQTISFTVNFLPGEEPPAKQRARHATKDRYGNFLKKVRTYTPDKTENAEEVIRWACYKFWPKRPNEGPVKVDLRVFRPFPEQKRSARALKNLGGVEMYPKAKIIKASAVSAPTDSTVEVSPWAISKPDNDNYEKLVFDALNGIFWVDDGQIISNRTEKLYSTQPRFEINITFLNN